MGTFSETNPSIWVVNGPTTDFAPFSGSPGRVDVVVVGSGIFGLTTAVLLRREGLEVTVLDAGRIASGVTAHTTAKVTSLHGLIYAQLERSFGEEGARRYGEANQAAIEQIARTVDELGIDCDFERRSAFTYTEDPDRLDAVREEAEVAASLGLPARFTTAVDLPYAVQGAVEFTHQAQFHPRKYCVGLAQWLDANGATVHEHTRVTDVDEAGDGCVVTTTSGSLQADHVVLATHLPIVDPAALFARTHPARSYALSATLDGPVPEGMYLSADQPTRSVRPLVAGSNQVLLGGEGHKVGQDADTRERYAALEAWARKRFAVASIDHRWSAQDYMAADHVPYIGGLAKRSSRRHVATGFGKWGMTNGTVGAMIVTDRVVGRPSPWAETFDSTRLHPTAAAKDFVTENLNVAKRFVGDRVAALRAPEAEALRPGEGCVAEVDGTKMAVHRDDDGELHAVSASCTHLGCFVTWNTAERSWDCPCHGSRFDVGGRVIQGPAVRDLEAVQDDASAT